jgi:hypothetical protein
MLASQLGADTQSIDTSKRNLSFLVSGLDVHVGAILKKCHLTRRAFGGTLQPALRCKQGFNSRNKLSAELSSAYRSLCQLHLIVMETHRLLATRGHHHDG